MNNHPFACASSIEFPWIRGIIVVAPVELLACPEHRDEQLREMGVLDGSSPTDL
jgi:hypothetical protein